MRTISILMAVATLAVASPAFAQSTMNGGNSANSSSAIYGHSAVSARAMVYHGNGHREHALGSVRRPTVGNTANQRINGG